MWRRDLQGGVRSWLFYRIILKITHFDPYNTSTLSAVLSRYPVTSPLSEVEMLHTWTARPSRSWEVNLDLSSDHGCSILLKLLGAMNY